MMTLGDDWPLPVNVLSHVVISYTYIHVCNNVLGSKKKKKQKAMTDWITVRWLHQDDVTIL